MIVGILQPSYLPWVGYFDQILKSDVFVLYDTVQYDKNGWRNRNRIRTTNGDSQWLTVPVLTKGKSGQLLKDVRINNSDKWKEKHIKSMRQNYSRVPGYRKYCESLFATIESSNDSLCDLNESLIKLMCYHLGVKTKIVRSSVLDIQYTEDREDRLIQIIKHFGGETFIEGSSGRDYVHAEKFKNAGVGVWFQEYRHPEYPQGQCGSHVFVPYMSAIDLLFNCCERSLGIIKLGGSHAQCGS